MWNTVRLCILHLTSHTNLGIVQFTVQHLEDRGYCGECERKLVLTRLGYIMKSSNYLGFVLRSPIQVPAPKRASRYPQVPEKLPSSRPSSIPRP